MIDASNPIFQLNVRSEFPVIYTCKNEFNERDIAAAFGMLNQFKIYADYFALLVPLRKSDELRHLVRESAFKNDFIVLNYNKLWEILAAKSPSRQLTNCILEQIDLVRVSPYNISGPVSEKVYFGRAVEEKTILENISKNDYAILANRKAGKTSLLNKIAPILSNIIQYQTFYFDLQIVSDYESFYDQISDAYEVFEQEVAKFNNLSPLDFRKIINGIQKNSPNRQIILIFDEVDDLLSYDQQFNEKLFRTFRSLSQRKRARFIFSGTTELIRRVRHPDSPLFNFCNLMKIECLDKKSAKELVALPMRTLNVSIENEEKIVQRILDITVCHPNAIQYTCDQLIQRINEKQHRIITESDLDMVITSQAFYEYCEGLIWGQAQAMEKFIVYALWDHQEFTDRQVISLCKEQGISIDKAETSLEVLQDYSILKRSKNQYKFAFQEFAKLIEEHNDVAELADRYRQEVLSS